MSENIAVDVPPGITPMQLHQMMFIYNAVINGWTVKRVGDAGPGCFRFRKRVADNTQRTQYMGNGFLERFVNNMQRLQTVAPRLPERQTEVELTTAQLQEFELPVDQDIQFSNAN